MNAVETEKARAQHNGWLRVRAIGIVAGLWLVVGLLVSLVTAYGLHYSPALGSPWWAVPYPYNRIGLGMALLLALPGFYDMWQPTAKWQQAGLWTVIGAVAFMVAASCPLYSPLAFFSWYIDFSDEAITQGAWTIGWCLWSLTFIGSLGLILYLKRGFTPKSAPDTYGSAHFATDAEVAATALLNNDNPYSVYTSAWTDPATNTVHYLRSSGPDHVFAYAPTRSGKGVGLVIPTLLSYLGSTINSDFKLENWQLTAGYRQQAGQWVIKFAPTCADGSSARFNPLLEVRQGIHEVGDVQNIVDLLIVPDPNGKHDHWAASASSLLVATILHVLYAERDKSLSGVLSFLTNPYSNQEDTLLRMLMTEHDVDNCFGWIDSNSGLPVRIHPVVASGARSMLNKGESECTGIFSSAEAYLKLYRDPIIAENTSRSDFAIKDILNGEKPLSLYLGIPPSDITRIMPLMRLVLNQLLSRLTEEMDFTQGVNGAQPGRHPLLLMLDEFPQFGKLAFFQKALAYVAGYGIRAYLIAQDLTQLYAEYGHYQSIISNCHIRVAYAPNNKETADHLSDLLGPTTIIKTQRNYSGSRYDFVLKNVTAMENEVKRPLMTSDELMRMPPDKALIFKSGFPPIDGHKMYYYQDPVFSERAKIPAPAQSDRLTVTHPWNTVIKAAVAPPPDAADTLSAEPPAEEEAPLAAEMAGGDLL
jgi:type IV secretion system protein VirD4